MNIKKFLTIMIAVALFIAPTFSSVAKATEFKNEDNEFSLRGVEPPTNFIRISEEYKGHIYANHVPQSIYYTIGHRSGYLYIVPQDTRYVFRNGQEYSIFYYEGELHDNGPFSSEEK